MSSMAGSGGGGGAPNKLASLRAMFEKKDDSLSTSPPDRGRSSGAASSASSRNGASPRPLSKVRTSFIAVGGTAGMGLVRSDSNNSENTARRSAFSMDPDTNPKEIADTKETLNVELDARRKSTAISETIPESVLETPVPTPALEPVDKQLEIKTNGNPENGKSTSETTSPIQQSADAPIKKSSEGRSLKPSPVLTSTSKSTNGTGAKSPRSTGPVQTKTAAVSAKPATKPTTPATRTKLVPAAISTKKTSTTPKLSPRPAKSPLPKTPTTPKAVVQKKAPVKTATPTVAPKSTTKTPEKKPSRTSMTSTVSHKSPHKSPAPLKMGEGQTSAFVKPKPKSPTKPVHLPASLTAPTASSRSKTSGSTAPPPARSQSRATAAPTPSGVRRTQSLVRKSAIGPPPVKKEVSKSSGADAQHKSSVTSGSAPSEGFMTRMMRPTASSQSKTSEKSPPTPPKKSQPIKRSARQSTSRPSTRDSTSVQKAFEGSPKVSKTAPSKVAVKDKEVKATAVPEIPKVDDVPAIAEAVPETAAEAITIHEQSIADLKVEVSPVDEDMIMVGEKTECAPIVDETEVKAEEPAPIPKEDEEAPAPATEIEETPVPAIEIEQEIKQELPATTEVEASPKEAEIIASEIEKDVTETPAKVIESEIDPLEGTAERNADEGEVSVTEKEVESIGDEKNAEVEEEKGLEGEEASPKADAVDV